MSPAVLTAHFKISLINNLLSNLISNVTDSDAVSRFRFSPCNNNKKISFEVLKGQYYNVFTVIIFTVRGNKYSDTVVLFIILPVHISTLNLHT